MSGIRDGDDSIALRARSAAFGREPSIFTTQLKTMNLSIPFSTGCCALALLIASCAKEDSKSAATVLENAFKGAAAPVAPGSTPQATGVDHEISKAITAIRSQSYDEAFLTLRSVQAAPNITVDQYSAIETARLAVEREVANKAAAGDPAALRALKAIKGSH